MAIGEVIMVSFSVNNGEWVLDSGCTFHMSPNIYSFVLYKKVSSGKVMLGNNLSCETSGISYVQLQVSHGIVKTLTNKRYVLC